jgi:transposase
LQRQTGEPVGAYCKRAVHLARLLRADEITPVSIPTLAQEAVRDLLRAREDCTDDLLKARRRMSDFLLRHGIAYQGGNAWTGKHDRWLRTEALVQLPTSATLLTFDCDYDGVLAAQARRDRLDAAVEQMVSDSEVTDLVRRLGCLRGMSTLTAFALAVELGDWHRFTGDSIGSFVGLVPSEPPSGQARFRAVINRTGNGNARRLLIEAARHHKSRYTIGKSLRNRWDLAPVAARIRGDEGNRRLHQRWDIFISHRKRSSVTDVAIARELAGWCWSLAVMDG